MPDKLKVASTELRRETRYNIEQIFHSTFSALLEFAKAKGFDNVAPICQEYFTNIKEDFIAEYTNLLPVLAGLGNRLSAALLDGEPSQILQAFNLALLTHAGTVRKKSREPVMQEHILAGVAIPAYTISLNNVFFDTETTIVAGMLHDTVEDFATSIAKRSNMQFPLAIITELNQLISEYLYSHFPLPVHTAVMQVTLHRSSDTPEEKAITWKNMAENTDLTGALIKACDVISNGDGLPLSSIKTAERIAVFYELMGKLKHALTPVQLQIFVDKFNDGYTAATNNLINHIHSTLDNVDLRTLSDRKSNAVDAFKAVEFLINMLPSEVFALSGDHLTKYYKIEEYIRVKHNNAHRKSMRAQSRKGNKNNPKSEMHWRTK